MIEDRTLIRDVPVVSYDGKNSAMRTERIEVQIRWPAGGEPKRNGYEGEWRLLPQTAYGLTRDLPEQALPLRNAEMAE